MSDVIRTDFTTKINDIFKGYITKKDEKINKDFCKKALDKIVLKSYQKFPAEYLKYSNMRGILLYYGLGSGKTLTAINIMNSIKKDVILMLPASLKPNFEVPISKFYTNGKNVRYISYNAPNVVEQYEKIENKDKGIYNFFNNKLVIIDEAHVFFKNVISGKAKQAIEIFFKLMNAKNINLILLTGTLISGDPFSLVPIFNVLKGYIVENDKKYELFPSDREEFNKYFLSNEFNSIKNRDIFQDRISGLVLYYRGIKDEKQYIVPKNMGMKIIKCPMGKVQFINYMTARKNELDFERKAQFQKKKFEKSKYKKPVRESIGTYKINTAQICNFGFPDDVLKEYDIIIQRLGGKKPKNFKVTERRWQIMEKLYKPNQIWKMIDKLSGKILTLFNNISKNGKEFIFSRFEILGTRIIGLMLEMDGYTEFTEKDTFETLKKKKRFMIIDGDTKNKNKMTSIFNNPKNNNGDYIQIIIGTTVVSTGVSFTGLRKVHIFEPQWRYIDIEQAIGRAIRTCSHENLPINERNVKIYLYISTFPKKIIIDRGKTTDETLFESSLKRNKLNNTFLNAIKEASVNCTLNFYENSTEDEPLVCRHCLNTTQGIKLYPADINQHMIDGSKCYIEEKKIELLDSKYFKDGKRLKKDKNGNVYQWNGELMELVGFIRDDEFILNSQDDMWN